MCDIQKKYILGRENSQCKVRSVPKVFKKTYVKGGVREIIV